MTTALAYFKPYGAAAGSTTAVAFVCVRALSGLYASNISTAAVKKNWKPHAMTPFVDSKGFISPEWNRFLGDLANRKLGGSIFPTVPDLAQFITRQQVDALLTAAQDQMAQQNAQAIAAIREVLIAAGTTGAAAIPEPTLARQETNPQPIGIDFGETGGGGGGD